MSTPFSPRCLARLEALTPAARQEAESVLPELERDWGPELGLVRTMHPYFGDPRPVPPGGQHLVRETPFLARGFLFRDGPGDVDRAVQAINAVLANQFDVPGLPWDGTFRLYPTSPDPVPNAAVIWRDYDPNWREFVGTSLIVLLAEYGDRLPAATHAGMALALRRACRGTMTRAISVPLEAHYTNIALMKAFLLAHVGERQQAPVWREAGERLARDVYELFQETYNFPEYNAPTYYGVDFAALDLWITYGPTAEFRRMGLEMEAALWRETALYYHAGLRNLCGPFDRAYGIDMTRYYCLLGETLRLEFGPERAPAPAGQIYEDGHIRANTLHLAARPVRIPADVRADFERFNGPRHVRRLVCGHYDAGAGRWGPPRVATAFLGERLMFGGQITHGGWNSPKQFYAATAHWQAPGGTSDEIGWLRLRREAPLDAEALPDGETLRVANRPGENDTGSEEFAFEIGCPDVDPARIRAERWELPGLSVEVQTNAPGVSVRPQDGGSLKIVYNEGVIGAHSPVEFKLRLRATDQ